VKKIFVSAFLSILVWMPSAKSSEIPEFMSEIQAASEKYQNLANSPESVRLLKEGKKTELNTQLKALVPDKSKTVYDYFILSNMLYRTDISASNSFMKIADELSPENPFILFELAMHQHRAGKCDMALPMYEKAAVLFKKKQSPVLWGYITHCRLVLGNYDGAIESWRKINFRDHHTAIEKSMYDIFSSKDPDTEREKLLGSVNLGESDAVCELVDLDRNWELDWWNIETNKEYFEYDVAVANKLAKSNKKIQLAVGLCVDAVGLNDSEFRDYIVKSGYWDGKYFLPDGSMAAYTLIRELAKRNIASSQKIIEHYEDQLVKRFAEDPKNQRTLDTLAYLYSATKNVEKLKKIDMHGWKVLRIQKYAESYIIGIPLATPEFREAVVAAAVDFPNSVKIQGANAFLNHQSDAKAEFLMKYAAAQFSDVKNHRYGPHRLDDFMASIEHEVGTSKK
jgi:hypothetical protein